MSDPVKALCDRLSPVLDGERYRDVALATATLCAYSIAKDHDTREHRTLALDQIVELMRSIVDGWP